MKAVILAAGEGRRMLPLTKQLPKPLLPLHGKPLLEHLFNVLPDEVDEIVLVIGYLGDKIKERFGSHFKRFQLHYVHQEKPEGTSRALALAREYLTNSRFLSLYADDLHGKDDLAALLKHPLSVLVAEVTNPERFGVVTLDGDKVVRIIEKPSEPQSNLIVTGPAVLDERIFSYEPPRHATGEFFLAESIGRMVQDHDVIAVRQRFWLPIGYPEDLERAHAVIPKDSTSRKQSSKSQKGKK